MLLDLGLTPVDGAAPAGIDLLGATLQRLVNRSGEPIALIVDFASRLAVRNDAPERRRASVVHPGPGALPPGPQPSRRGTAQTVLQQRAVGGGKGRRPARLAAGGQPAPAPYPGVEARPGGAPGPGPGAAAARRRGVAEEALQQAAATFVENTEGLLLLDLNAIVQLARVEGLAMERIADAVRRYKVGVTEDPWLKIDHQRIRQADEIVRRRVRASSTR